VRGARRRRTQLTALGIDGALAVLATKQGALTVPEIVHAPGGGAPGGGADAWRGRLRVASTPEQLGRLLAEFEETVLVERLALDFLENLKAGHDPELGVVPGVTLNAEPDPALGVVPNAALNAGRGVQRWARSGVWHGAWRSPQCRTRPGARSGAWRGAQRWTRGGA